MAGIEDLTKGFDGILAPVGGVTGLVTILLIGLVCVGLIGLVLWYFLNKLKWNLQVEIKMPRSNGAIINAEWGKGSYDKKRGVVFIKRKKMKKQPLKPFDIKRYLQGSNVLTVVQVGIDDFRPILQESYLKMTNDKPMKDEEGNEMKDSKGKPIFEEAALMNIKMDTTESKSWRDSFERESKSTYSITNLLHEYSVYIGYGLIILLWGVQFFMLYSKMS